MAWHPYIVLPLIILTGNYFAIHVIGNVIYEHGKAGLAGRVCERRVHLLHASFAEHRKPTHSGSSQRIAAAAVQTFEEWTLCCICEGAFEVVFNESEIAAVPFRVSYGFVLM